MPAFALLPSRVRSEPAVTPIGPSTAGTTWPDRSLLWSILALALALRVGAAILFPGAHHPDETFQAFEQAHLTVFGYGIAAWEFDDGLRSPLLPAFLSGVFRIAQTIFGTPEAMLPLSRILLAALSLLPVAAIYAAGLRLSRRHALIGSLVAATWVQLIYFSYRPLTEALAADFLLTALALTSFRATAIPRTTLAAIGSCLGLALMLRLQFAPAVAVVGIAASGWAWRGKPYLGCSIPLALGAAGPIALFGIADWIVWGAPFYAPYTAFRLNIVEDVAARFGTAPTYAYVFDIAARLGWLALPIGLLLRFGVRRYALWLIVAAAIVVPHSLIAHKEYRFVFVTIPILAVAASFASVDVIALWLRARSYELRQSRVALACLACVWMMASAWVASMPAQSKDWQRLKAETAAFEMLSRDAMLCGLALDGLSWQQTAGYAALHRPIPIFQFRTGQRPPDSTAFNTVMSRAASTNLDGYDTLRCFDDAAATKLCILRRPGHCKADPKLVPLTDMRRLGDPLIYFE